MSIEVCPTCTCRFAVGLLRCPQCGTGAPLFADRITNQEEPMPRITVAAGPSNAAAQPGETGYIEPEIVAAPVVEVEEPAPVLVVEAPDAPAATAEPEPVPEATAAVQELAEPAADTTGGSKR